MIKKLLLIFINIYKYMLSPVLGKSCRFYPTCSTYAQQALNQYSLFVALRMIFIRLLKCHPFHEGGVDLLNKEHP